MEMVTLESTGTDITEWTASSGSEFLPSQIPEPVKISVEHPGSTVCKLFLLINKMNRNPTWSCKQIFWLSSIICGGEITHPTTSGEWKHGVDPHTFQ